MNRYNTFLIFFLIASSAFAHSMDSRFSTQPQFVLKSELLNTPYLLTWNAESLVYYTAEIQNDSTKIDIFDADGSLTKTEQFSFPTKGLWYNSALDFLEAYNHQSNSCFSFFIDDHGVFENQDTLHRLSEVQESTDKMPIVYNAYKDVYAYVEPITGMIIEVESHSGAIDNYITVQFPVDKKQLDFKYFFFTEIENTPYAFVNTTEKMLYFVDQEGQVIESTPFPSSDFIPSAYSFANGMFWMYQSNAQSWFGYSLY